MALAQCCDNRSLFLIIGLSLKLKKKVYPAAHSVRSMTQHFLKCAHISNSKAVREYSAYCWFQLGSFSCQHACHLHRYAGSKLCRDMPARVCHKRLLLQNREAAQQSFQQVSLPTSGSEILTPREQERNERPKHTAISGAYKQLPSLTKLQPPHCLPAQQQRPAAMGASLRAALASLSVRETHVENTDPTVMPLLPQLPVCPPELSQIIPATHM